MEKIILVDENDVVREVKIAGIIKSTYGSLSTNKKNMDEEKESIIDPEESEEGLDDADDEGEEVE